LRKEHFIPELTDRRSYEAWLKDGAQDIVGKAKEKIRTTLGKHQHEPLEKNVHREIQDIIVWAKSDLIEH
jgi:trimethylamine:corrinoid methyltransferase-like protein